MIKTYGCRVQIPTSWPVESSANGNRQRVLIVATTSIPKAIAALNEALGVQGYISANSFRVYGYSNMGGAAKEIAEAQPGKVFIERDDSSPSRGYELAPGQEDES